MEGIVIKKIADTFVVKTPNSTQVYSPRGNLKKDGVFVGDNVIVCENNKTIDRVLQRKNLLVRPTTANLSQLVIVIAPVPKPDFAIVDKLLLFCYLNDIEPVICVNKTDILPENEKLIIKQTYERVCRLVFVSAKHKDNLSELKEILKNHISALTGQSAVGKSELLNAIYKADTAAVGELAKKVARGKHTTRHTELFELEENTFLADTPGFSRLEVNALPVEYFNLRYYYPDFLIFHSACKYSSCTHTNEENCGIKNAILGGLLSKQRHENYLNIFEMLKKEQTYAKK